MVASTKMDLATAKAKELQFKNGEQQYPFALFGNVMKEAGFQPTDAELEEMTKRFEGFEGNFGFELFQNEVTQWFTNVLAQERQAGVSRNKEGRMNLNKESLEYVINTLKFEPELAANRADWKRTEFNRKLREFLFSERVPSKGKKSGSSTRSSEVETSKELVKASSTKVQSWLRSLETTTGEPLNKRALEHELETTCEPVNKKSKGRLFWIKYSGNNGAVNRETETRQELVSAVKSKYHHQLKDCTELDLVFLDDGGKETMLENEDDFELMKEGVNGKLVIIVRGGM